MGRVWLGGAHKVPCKALALRYKKKTSGELSGPLNRLNAILSLLQPIDRYRAPLR